ncbi:MAG TPA: hypothetical protein DCQ31_09770 [Bacteroidales bacterium]|nr:hypothetical protein [Bacteroidales bacterium]
MKKTLIVKWILVGIIGIMALESNAQLKILTGVAGEEYDLLGQDIMNNVEKDKVKLQNTGGGKANIGTMVAGEIAITQYDVLQKALMQDLTEASGKTDNIRILLPLGRTEVHLIVRTNKRDFTSLKDLNSPDVKVSVGTKDHSSYVTAQAIKELTGSTWTDVELPLNESIQALLNNEIDALLYVGSAPVPQFAVFSKLPVSEQNTIKLIPIEHLKVRENYDAGRVMGGTYKWANYNVETIVAKTILVANVAKETKEQTDAYIAILRDIKKNILLLQKDGKSAQWKQTNFIFTGMEWDVHKSAEDVFFPKAGSGEEKKDGDAKKDVKTGGEVKKDATTGGEVKKDTKKTGTK